MRWLEHLEEVAITVLMAAMTLLAFGQVVARYVFNYSFVWALELTGVMFAWLIFLGMSYGVRVGAHIGIDALVSRFGPAVARGFGLLAAALCVVYAAILAYGGWVYVHKMYDVGILMQDMPVAQWIPRAILPIGFVLLGWRFAQLLYRLATGQAARLLGDEAEDALRYRVDPADATEAGR